MRLFSNQPLTRQRVLLYALIAATVAVIPLALVSWHVISGYEQTIQTQQDRLAALERRTQDLQGRPVDPRTPDADLERLRQEFTDHIAILKQEQADREQRIVSLERERGDLLRRIRTLELQMESNQKTPNDSVARLTRERDDLTAASQRQAEDIAALNRERDALNQQITALHKHLWEIEVKRGWSQKVKRE